MQACSSGLNKGEIREKAFFTWDLAVTGLLDKFTPFIIQLPVL
jgi:hypothetical protein